MNILENKVRCDMCNRKLKYSNGNMKLTLRHNDDSIDDRDGAYTICEACYAILTSHLEHRR